MNRFTFKLIIISTLLLYTSTLFAQDKKGLSKDHLVFSESKIVNLNEKVVYFCLSEVRDQDHQIEIQKALLELSEVKKVRIYLDLNQDCRCQMTTFRDVTPEDLQETLKQVQTDFLYESVKKEKSSNKTNDLN